MTPVTAPAPTPLATSLAHSLSGAVASVMAGRHEQIEVATACVLAGGHLLIEDIPGVGKTLLAQSMAAAVGGTFSRVQGSADLLPADVVGTLAPAADGFGLHFRPGPVFAHVVLFDELNRANPRTQSALLVVMATQSPVEMAGTYPLAEGVTDRFTAAISLGRASAEEEVEVLTGRRGRGRLAGVGHVASPAELAAARAAVAHVHVADVIAAYAVALLHATREHPRVRLGASTRAGVAMVGMARAFALMAGRDHVAPHDIARAARCTLAHRLVLDTRDRILADVVVDECLAQVPAPRR